MSMMDNIKGVVNKDNPQGETLTSNPESSRLFKRLELPGTINSENSAYLTLIAGFLILIKIHWLKIKT